MAFCAAVRKESVSVLRYPLLSHLTIIILFYLFIFLYLDISIKKNKHGTFCHTRYNKKDIHKLDQIYNHRKCSAKNFSGFLDKKYVLVLMLILTNNALIVLYLKLREILLKVIIFI